jgi:NADH-quinone oxidoreductase subunit N
MILGNLAALSQSDIKRLLAYSAVAHAGYALLGAVAGSRPGMSSLIYYVVTYAVAVLGAFGVVAVVESNVGNSRLTDLAGLARRAPGLSFCMLIFVLSLAGIPPLAGFFGKFHLFAAVLSSASGNLPLLWLIILAIGLSAVSLYYYLQVLKQIYVVDSPTIQSRIHVEPTSALAIMLAAVLVLVLGCAPDLLLQPIVAAIAESGF